MLGFLLYYVVEALKYIVGYELIFRERLRRLWLFLLGLVAYAAILLCIDGGSDSDILLPMLPIVLICTAIAVPGSFRHGLKQLLILILFESSFDPILNICMDLLGWFTSSGIRALNIRNLISLGFILLIFGLRDLYDRYSSEKLQEQRTEVRESAPYWSALFLIVLCFSLSLLGSVPLSESDKLLVRIVSFLGYAVIIVIIRLIIYSTRVNKRLNEMVALEKELMDMKTDYYEILLKKEEDTRRYRHDMMNHYICMKQYSEAGRSDQLNAYLDELMQGLEQIRNETYSVGNRTIEIILNYYMNMLDSSIEKTVLGMAPQELGISDAELSTVFGNLMSNAVEELRRSEAEHRMIRVEFKQGRQFMSIIVSNSVTGKKQIGDDRTIISEKHDTANHGFGLRNVREVVERAGGRLDIACDDATFNVTVYLKLNQ